MKCLLSINVSSSFMPITPSGSIKHNVLLFLILCGSIHTYIHFCAFACKRLTSRHDTSFNIHFSLCVPILSTDSSKVQPQPLTIIVFICLKNKSKASRFMATILSRTLGSMVHVVFVCGPFSFNISLLSVIMTEKALPLKTNCQLSSHLCLLFRNFSVIVIYYLFVYVPSSPIFFSVHLMVAFQLSIFSLLASTCSLLRPPPFSLSWKRNF